MFIQQLQTKVAVTLLISEKIFKDKKSLSHILYAFNVFNIEIDNLLK